jgi:adenylate cyclase
MEIVEQKLWKHIELYTRIGLHFWEAILWDVWDNESKMSYTAIWDNVNLASRLEWINKYYGTNIIVSQDFYEKIQKKEDFLIRLIDKITVKWKSTAINIYHIYPQFEFETDEEFKKYIFYFNKWLSFYFKWEFEKAQKILQELSIYKISKQDDVITTFLERIKYLIKNPPQNWDGVRRYNSK